MGPLVIQFTDYEIETAPVLCLFLTFLTRRVVLGNYPSTDTLIRLVRFAKKWDCPRVIKKVIHALQSALKSRAMDFKSICIVAAALDNLQLCEAVVLQAATLSKSNRPWKTWELPSEWEYLIPEEYHNALCWGTVKERSHTAERRCVVDLWPRFLRQLYYRQQSRPYVTPQDVADEFRARVNRVKMQQRVARRLLRWVEESRDAEYDDPEVQAVRE